MYSIKIKDSMHSLIIVTLSDFVLKISLPPPFLFACSLTSTSSPACKSTVSSLLSGGRRTNEYATLRSGAQLKRQIQTLQICNTLKLHQKYNSGPATYPV